MWTVERLRDEVEARGQSMPSAELVGHALLAYERWQGRTEEDYNPHKAKRELDRILDLVEWKGLPLPRNNEFPGMQELRAYSAERKHARESEQQKAGATMEKPAPVQESAKPVSDRAKEQRDTDRER